MIQIAQNKPGIAEYNGKEPLKGKRERFAQLIATGTKNQTEAHKQAGYKEWKGSGRYANDLAHNPIIVARIAYIRAELAKRWEITKDSQVKNYLDISDRAKVVGDLRAEISANNSIDKLSGLITDKTLIERSDAQVAYDATQRRLGAAFAKWQLTQSLARPEASEAVNVVDITVDGASIGEANGSSGCTSGCSDGTNSAITGQDQG